MNQELFIVTEIQRTSRVEDSAAQRPQPEKFKLLDRVWTWLIAPWEEVNTPVACVEVSCA